MSEYIAPLKDIRFVMQELAGLEQVVACLLYTSRCV